MDIGQLDIISYVLSIISILFYSVVYFPQFHILWKKKSSEGISIWMLLIWSQADALSLIGTILLVLDLNLIVVGWYHLFVGILMTGASFYYKESRKYEEWLAIFLFCFGNIFAGAFLTKTYWITKDPQYISGETIGWITTCLYIIGRFPQFYLNYKRKSAKGLSILMYIFTMLGNTFYLMSIVVYTGVDDEYIRLNIPWIVVICVTVTMDILLIFQAKYYEKMEFNIKRSEIEEIITF